MFSDQLRQNLILDPEVDINGPAFHGGQGEIRIRWGKFLFSAYLEEQIYSLYPQIPNSDNRSVKFEALSAGKNGKIMHWHRQYGHNNQCLPAQYQMQAKC